MAYKLIWSPASRDDLHDIVVFISLDDPQRALTYGYRWIFETDKLQNFPEIGRMAPEFRRSNIGEIIGSRHSTNFGVATRV